MSPSDYDKWTLLTTKPYSESNYSRQSVLEWKYFFIKHMKQTRRQHIVDENTMRGISTAVTKFSKMTPELLLWRSKHRFVKLLLCFVRSGRISQWKDMMVDACRLVLKPGRQSKPLSTKIPRMVNYLIRISRRSHTNRVGVLSIFNVHRIVTLKPKYEFESISSPFSGYWPNDEVEYLMKASRVFVAMSSFKGSLYDESYAWVKSWAAGPNGAPAWDYILEDFIACSRTKVGTWIRYFLESFPLRGREDLKYEMGVIEQWLAELGISYSLKPIRGPRTFRKFANSVGTMRVVCALRRGPIDSWSSERHSFKELNSVCEDLFQNFSFSKANSRLGRIRPAPLSEYFSHSRLHFLSDKAGKTRVIALGDAISQTLLKPLHRYLFNILRGIPFDGTFDQERQKERVRKATAENGRKCFSIDMKSCTDRLPVILQMAVLTFSDLLTKEQSLAWYLLLVKRSFLIRKLKRGVTYAVGQPMGLLSSWAVMSVTHHVLVQWAALRIGVETPFTNYAILGDDICLWDDSVAASYKVLLEKFGVEISRSKTLEELNLAEFAKSWFSKGKDLQPLSAALVMWRSDFGSAMLIEVARQLALKGLYLAEWLSDSFNRIGKQKLLKLLTLYGSRIPGGSSYYSPNDQEKYYASILQFNSTVSSPVDGIESQAFSSFLATMRDYRGGQAKFRWGNRLKAGPASLLFYEYMRCSWWRHHLNVSRGSAMPLDVCVVPGDKWIMWNTRVWDWIRAISNSDETNPLNIIEVQTLSLPVQRKLRFRPEKLDPRWLTKVWSPRRPLKLSERLWPHPGKMSSIVGTEVVVPWIDQILSMDMDLPKLKYVWSQE